MSGRGETFAAVIASLVTVAALDAALSYVMWGIGFGMKDVQWNPLFSMWVVVGIIAAVFVFRLLREHRDAVRRTAILGGALSIPYFVIVWYLGIWACGDGGGCRGMR